MGVVIVETEKLKLGVYSEMCRALASGNGFICLSRYVIFWI
jgi:hypothetical protein